MNMSFFGGEGPGFSDSLRPNSNPSTSSNIEIKISNSQDEKNHISDSLSDDLESVLSDKTVIVDDSLMRELDLDENDTISVIVQTPDTLDISMYPHGEPGFSPKVSLSKANNISTLVIFDKDGRHETQIADGAASELDVQIDGSSIVNNQIANFQSGTNVKTVNGQSILGPGNVEVSNTVLKTWNSTDFND